MARENNLSPVFCVQDRDAVVPEGVEIIAYEPVFAIGTSNPDTPENAEEVARHIKEKNKGVSAILYGGSVTPENVHEFTVMDSIDGVLVGGSSLDAQEFYKIIENA